MRDTVLIVEEDGGVLEVLQMLFETLEWRVVTSRFITLVQPVFEPEADRIAVAFWSGTLSRVPGNEAGESARDCFRRLSSELQGIGAPFALMDGVRDQERDELARSAGMLELPKPFTLDELETFLRENVRPE